MLKSISSRTFCLFIVLFCLSSAKTNAEENRLCLPTEAVADVENFSISSKADAATKIEKLLGEMGNINSKAKVPNEALGDQLSNKDKLQFERLRESYQLLRLQELILSTYLRDMHVISDLQNIAEIYDQYGIDQKGIPANSPILFYINVIGIIREFQPEPPEGTKPDLKNGCTMALALYIQEHISMDEMAKQPTNIGILNYITDIRRIETLMNVMSKQLEFNIEDLNDAHFQGDEPKFANRFSQWIKTQSKSTQSMSKIELYLDAMLPANMSYQLWSESKRTAGITKDEPSLIHPAPH